MRWTPLLTCLVVLATCAPSAEPGTQPRATPASPDEAGPTEASVGPDAIWFDVLEVTPQAPDVGHLDLA